jgi:hypothetical protein
MRAKYGGLSSDTWHEDIRQEFSESFRVPADDGVLIFKWAETKIKFCQVLALASYQPSFGRKPGKRHGTHWISFMKESGQ